MINQPHEGGIAILKMFFGQEAWVDPVAGGQFTVLFYIQDSADSAPVFLDADAYDANDVPDNLVDFGSSVSSDYASYIDFGASTGLEVVTSAELDTDPDSMIRVVAGVPQIEFPEVNVVFSNTPVTGINRIYGYALV